MRAAVAEAIMRRLAEADFEHDAVFAYGVDAMIARREKFL